MADHAANRGGFDNRGADKCPTQEVIQSTPPEPSDQAIDEAAIEAGRRLFARECTFIAGASRLDSVPIGGLPEIAFAGRSNVGKSSLVNALTGRKTLARVSRTPGRTQQINFFSLDDRLGLVDLPGYGFAQASKQRVADWTALIRLYLKGRPSLRRVCLLIDARHGFKDIDRMIATELDAAAVSYQLILTKADQLAPRELADAIESLRGEISSHPAAHPDIHATSAQDGGGIAVLRGALAALAAPESIR
ncbi:MAG: YihA family ribosome biogenesis GTP-binding protein [Rhodospirillaceae bacterium]|nr:YihA family ribosome biogenesis GTP-binding protein [Rhodospirillaceae bacterium]